MGYAGFIKPLAQRTRVSTSDQKKVDLREKKNDASGS